MTIVKVKLKKKEICYSNITHIYPELYSTSPETLERHTEQEELKAVYALALQMMKSKAIKVDHIHNKESGLHHIRVACNVMQEVEDDN